MAYVSTTDQIAGDRLVGAAASGPSPMGARDQYEYGSVMLQRAGRYKAFTTGFSARPIVTVTSFAGPVGSANAKLMGTPNTGSFRVRLGGQDSGSVNAHFQAFGAR